MRTPSTDLARPDDLLSVISHYEVVAKKLGIDVRLNTKCTRSSCAACCTSDDVCVIAAGASLDRKRHAHVKAPSDARCAGCRHGRAKTGKRVVVVGGGKIGLTSPSRCASTRRRRSP